MIGRSERETNSMIDFLARLPAASHPAAIGLLSFAVTVALILTQPAAGLA